MSELELELLKAEADEAAARARVEVLRRAAGTRAPDRLRSDPKRKPRRATPPAPALSETDAASAQRLARELGIPVASGGRR